MLRKKTGGVAIGPRLSSALTELTGGAIDRRTFLKRSGLAIGGLAAASTLTNGMVTKAEAQTAAGAKSRLRNRSAPTARSAVPSLLKCKAASGWARSPAMTARSTWAPTAPKVQRCASTLTASAG